jgi:hypothetical protein
MSKIVRETEAGAVVFVVCQAIGLGSCAASDGLKCSLAGEPLADLLWIGTVEAPSLADVISLVYDADHDALCGEIGAGERLHG